MKLRFEIEIGTEGNHCIDDNRKRCHFYRYEFTDGFCSLFKTKQYDFRKIYGDPPRRCKQCLESEIK